MNKILVVYYSNAGNNRYLANKMAKRLSADIEELKPKLNIFPILVLSSLMKLSLGIKPLQNNVSEYEKIVLCGPVWMGQLVAPLRDFIGKYNKVIKSLYFVTCCGSTDKLKDDKFGYGNVFRLVKKKMGDKYLGCEALSISLVVPDEIKENSEEMMKVRLSDENFKGEIKEKFDTFVKKINEK